MKRAAKSTLLILAPCAAFALGILIGRAGTGKPAAPCSEPGIGGDLPTSQGDRARTLQAVNEKLSRELEGRDWRIVALEDEIEELSQELPNPFAPEDEKEWREYEERQEFAKQRRALAQKAQELREKILQRKDKALRQEALAELDRLMQSENTEELIIGLSTFRRLPDFILDKETKRMHVVTALEHQNADVRYEAIYSLYWVCTREENLDVLLDMWNDPAARVRQLAVALLHNYTGNQRDERVATVLKKFLSDEDASVNNKALRSLSPGYDYREEMEDRVIELSRDPETREEAHQCLSGMKTIDAKVAQRLVELFDFSRGWGYEMYWMERDFTDDALPIVSRFCLELVQDCPPRWQKQKALQCLRRIGDASVLRELEALQRSPVAEGIEDELTKTIRALWNKVEGQQR